MVWQLTHGAPSPANNKIKERTKTDEFDRWDENVKKYTVENMDG